MMSQRRVAILTTGDELINGDVMNTNGPYLARALDQQNIRVGQQLTASDDQEELETGIQYLLKHHHILITIGGLGPTSDDRTRFALSHVLDKPLLFHQDSWDRIVARIQRLNMSVADSNKQQALFPEGATVIPNDHGSADGCEIIAGEHRIFMLPGPPNECLPIFDNVVLPRLLIYDLQKKIYRKQWLLMRIGESNLAQRLDALLENGITLGYRFAYPYIEVKLSSPDKKVLDKKIQEIRPLIQEFVVSEDNQTASQQFLQRLKQYQGRIAISDHATGGRLQALLYTPATCRTLIFADVADVDVRVKIAGLNDYWQQQSNTTELIITMNGKTISHSLNFTGDRVLKLAVELICQDLITALQ